MLCHDVDLVSRIVAMRGDVIGAIAEQFLKVLPMHCCMTQEGGSCREKTLKLQKQCLQGWLIHRGYLRDVMRGPILQAFFTELLETSKHGVIARSDINNLKGMNNVLGRQEADEILIRVAKYHKEVYEQLGGLVFLVHTGGDEVDIFVTGCSEERFRKAEEEVRAMVDKLGREPFGSRGVILTDIPNPRCPDSTRGRFGLRTAIYPVTREDLIARCLGDAEPRESRRLMQEISDYLDDGLEAAKKVI